MMKWCGNIPASQCNWLKQEFNGLVVLSAWGINVDVVRSKFLGIAARHMSPVAVISYLPDFVTHLPSQYIWYLCQNHQRENLDWVKLCVFQLHGLFKDNGPSLQ